ncbi:MAG: Uncharacterized protein XD78_1376 [Desulfotomaculum sp. 46_296]|nr:MAG: Uncharacterized protein XD78_1376 [Desulfotomaculum sp. 46_296]HAU32759.1 hypothetical protein [Desulfotomaculum sp.]
MPKNETNEPSRPAKKTPDIETEQGTNPTNYTQYSSQGGMQSQPYGQPQAYGQPQQQGPMFSRPMGAQQPMASQPYMQQAFQLYQQIQQLKTQAIQEQQYNQQYMKQSINQAISLLNQGMQYLQPAGAFSQMIHAIDNMQQLLKQIAGQQAQEFQPGQHTYGSQYTYPGHQGPYTY